MNIRDIIRGAFPSDEKSGLICEAFLGEVTDHEPGAELSGWERIQKNVDQVDLERLRALSDDEMSVVLPGVLAGLTEVNEDLGQEVACYLFFALFRLLAKQDNFFTRYSSRKKTAIIAAFDELVLLFNYFDDYERLWLKKWGLLN